MTSFEKVIDLFQTEPIPNGIKKILKNYKNIIIIDEQIKNSSLISSFGLIFLENKIAAKFKGFCLKDNYVFDNGGREKLLNNNGISVLEIKKYLNRL